MGNPASTQQIVPADLDNVSDVERHISSLIVAIKESGYALVKNLYADFLDTENGELRMRFNALFESRYFFVCHPGRHS